MGARVNVAGPTAEPSRYLVELEPPEAGWDDIQALVARSRAAAEELRRSGSAVRFLRSVFVPEDGTVYLLFEGPSESAVREAVSHAGLGVEGVVASLQLEIEHADQGGQS
jgi:hypothetical protein